MQTYCLPFDRARAGRRMAAELVVVGEAAVPGKVPLVRVVRGARCGALCSPLVASIDTPAKVLRRGHRGHRPSAPVQEHKEERWRMASKRSDADGLLWPPWRLNLSVPERDEGP